MVIAKNMGSRRIVKRRKCLEARRGSCKPGPPGSPIIILILCLILFSGCAPRDVNPDLEMMLHFYQQHNATTHKLFEMEAFPGQEIRLKGVSRLTVYAPKKDFDFQKVKSAIPQKKSAWETTVSGLVTIAQYAAPVVGYVLGLQAQGRSIYDALTASGGGQNSWAGDYTIWTDSPYTIENNPETIKNTGVVENE